MFTSLRLSARLFEISCLFDKRETKSQTDRQTDRQTDPEKKNPLDHIVSKITCYMHMQ